MEIVKVTNNWDRVGEPQHVFICISIFCACVFSVGAGVH